MADKNIKWIALHVALLSDDKIKLIKKRKDGRSIVLLFIELLLIAGQQNQKGEISIDDRKYTKIELATIANYKSNKVFQREFNTLLKYQLVEETETGHIIKNWEKYQNVKGMEKIREGWRKRKEESRRNQKLRENGIIKLKKASNYDY